MVRGLFYIYELSESALAT